MPIHDLHPRIAVVLIGVNNAENTSRQIAAGIRAVIDKTQQLFPGIKIILVSILPNRRTYSLMMDTNDLIRSFDDQKTIFFLDLVPLFLPNGDNWIGIGNDHLHPNEAGYRIWADAMNPLLEKIATTH